MNTRPTPPPTHHQNGRCEARVGGYERLSFYCDSIDDCLGNHNYVNGGVITSGNEWVFTLAYPILVASCLKTIQALLQADSVKHKGDVLTVTAPKARLFVIEGEYREVKQEKCVNLVDMIDSWRGE